MKKIYASMIALACGAFITAGAKTLTPVVTISIDKNARVAEVVDDAPVAAAKTFDARSIKKAKAESEFVEVGSGYFYDGIFSQMELPVTIEESTAKPGYYRMNPWSVLVGEEMPYFFIDCTNPNNCKIPLQDTGLEYVDGSTTEIISFSSYVESEGLTDDEFLSDDEFNIYAITFEDGFINIPEDAILASFPEDKVNTGLYHINNPMYINMPNSGIPAQWGETAVGQMRDGFLEPLFNGYEIATRDYTFQKNNWKEGYYRVFEPWVGLFGENYGGPALYIDASNPDWVVVPYQTTGINATGRGICYILSCSALYDSAEKFFASDDADANITMDANGKITINMVDTPLKDGTVLKCAPIYTNWPKWEGNEDGLYVTEGEDCFIQIPEFTGISSVAIDENAATEIYNIQGQRVVKPAQGQMVIIKQGDKVSKTIVK